MYHMILMIYDVENEFVLQTSYYTQDPMTVQMPGSISLFLYV